jgi:capsular exopolysaccharide synthesis family protein
LEPFENRLKENFIFAFFLSLLGSFIIVFVSIYRDRVYKSAQDLESDHGIPVIASIPNTAGLKTAKQIFNLMSLKPNNHLFEAYRKAANALYFSSEDGLPRVFAVTSANVNEGKTLTSFALALEYSSAGQKVLLVDVHLRDPKLHQIFNIENHHGLTNILVSDEAPINVTHDTPFSNLYLICAGPSPANPTQLLASNRLGEFLDVAKQNFDLIILDCPAINVLDEMLLVGAVADHLVICLRSEITTKISVKKAIKKILSIQRLPTGFILTDQRNSFYSKFQFKNKVNVKKISESSRASLLSKKVIPTH